jgi:hypothetical protein
MKMNDEKLSAMTSAWQAKYGRDNCETVFGKVWLFRALLLAESVERQELESSQLFFRAAIDTESTEITIALISGEQELGKYRLESRTSLPTEDLYERLTSEHPQLRANIVAKEKFIVPCNDFFNAVELGMD